MFSQKPLRFRVLIASIFLLSSRTAVGAQDSDSVQCLNNCPGAVIDNGACDRYQIMSAIGDGLVVHETNLRVEQPKITGASGNGIIVSSAGGGVVLANAVVQNVDGCGIVIRGDGCYIDGGTINGARNIGLLVIGNRNVITDIKITNCMKPIVIQGVGNIVSWSSASRPPVNDSVRALDPNLPQNFPTGDSMSVQGQVRLKQP